MIKEEKRFASSVVFEGMTSIRAVLRGMESDFNNRKIEKILYDEARESDKSKELSYLRHMAKVHDFTVVPSARQEIDAMSTGSSHGGIIAVCSDRTIPELTADSFVPNGFYVMLEGIEDPYNFGYALRSIYAAGGDGIILTPRNWMSAAGVVCRSSAGASEMLPLFIASASDAVVRARAAGYRIVCAGIRDSVSAFDAPLHRPILLIVGGEKRGISRAVLDEADVIVRLEYGREFNGSLSAASAASILAYEVLRQNR